MKAQMARGVDFTSGPVKERVKAIVPLLVPLFVSAFKRAEELAVAMEARGYQGGEGRTKYRKLACMDRKRHFCHCQLNCISCFVIFLKGLEVLYETEMHDFL